MGNLTTVSLSVTLDCNRCRGNEVRAIVDRITCASCHKRASFSPELWCELLDPMVHEMPHMPTLRPFTRSIGGGRVEAVNRAPSCASCAEPISTGDVARATTAGHHACGSCGERTFVRPTPPLYAAALPGVTHLLGEDPQIVADPDTIVPVDAADQTFYLVHDDSVPRSAGRAQLHWEALSSVAGDTEGNVYGIAIDATGGYQGKEMIVFSIDPLGRTRWIRRNVDEDVEDRSLAVSNEGNLLFWTPASALAIHCSSVDGRRVGTIGQPQPQSSPTYTLDLKDASEVALDVDGSIVLRKYERLARCLLDGTAAPMWPPRKAFFGLRTVVSNTEPFLSSNLNGLPSSASVEQLEDYPEDPFGGRIHFGWDGSLYIWSGNQVASFDRAGRKRWLVTLAANVNAIGGDAAGNLCVLSAPGEVASIDRVAADGTVSSVVDGNANRFVLPRHSLLVARDGRMVALNTDGGAYALAADGKVLWQREPLPPA